MMKSWVNESFTEWLKQTHFSLTYYAPLWRGVLLFVALKSSTAWNSNNRSLKAFSIDSNIHPLKAIPFQWQRNQPVTSFIQLLPDAIYLRCVCSKYLQWNGANVKTTLKNVVNAKKRKKPRHRAWMHKLITRHLAGGFSWQKFSIVRCAQHFDVMRVQMTRPDAVHKTIEINLCWRNTSS